MDWGVTDTAFKFTNDSKKQAGRIKCSVTWDTDEQKKSKTKGLIV